MKYLGKVIPMNGLSKEANDATARKIEIAYRLLKTFTIKKFDLHPCKN